MPLLLLLVIFPFLITIFLLLFIELPELIHSNTRVLSISSSLYQRLLFLLFSLFFSSCSIFHSLQCGFSFLFSPVFCCCSVTIYIFTIHFPFTTLAFLFHSFFFFFSSVHGCRILLFFNSLSFFLGVGRPWASSRIFRSCCLPSLKPLLAMAQTSLTFRSKVSISRSCRIASYCLRFTSGAWGSEFNVAKAKVVGTERTTETVGKGFCFRGRGKDKEVGLFRCAVHPLFSDCILVWQIVWKLQGIQRFHLKFE